MREILIKKTLIRLAFGLAVLATAAIMLSCITPSSPSNVLADETVISATTNADALAQIGQLDGRKKKRKQQNNEPQPEWIEWTPGDVWPIPEPTPCEDDNLLWWRPDCE